ncbi:fascin domain-containing protein [Dactylosporangium sp. CA-152071]|uniref:fascin domain-containing protein n=1 Tax=Dactylosporangium sp. CA-152071 TaxID=3239933 RepID=UPI003D91ADE9
MRRARGLLSAVVVLLALLVPASAHAAPSPGASPTAAEDDPATKGLTRTSLDLGGGEAQANALGPVGIPGASICQRFYIYSYRAARYVSEEQGYTGSSHNMLRARSTAGALGTWEHFRLCAYNGRTDTIYIQASSGYLVTAEYGYSGNLRGMMRGRGEWPGVWEVFEVWSDAGVYYLRNQSTKGWVSVRVDMTGSSANMLRANGASAGPWEMLAFTSVA